MTRHRMRYEQVVDTLKRFLPIRLRRVVGRVVGGIVPTTPPRDIHGFEYTVKELVGLHENSKIATQWHGKVIDDDILRYKTSDTVFLLGSGPSINDITPAEWEHIRLHDSVGFNYWFAHDFVPTVYVFQAASESMLEILKDKYAQYEGVPFLMRGSAFAKGEFEFDDARLNLLSNNPVYYINEYPISSRCSIDIGLLIRYMEALGFMTFGHISDFIPKWRGTLGLLIMLAYQMGYRNVVLCGMDMHDSDHFWDYEPYLHIKQKYSLPDRGAANMVAFTDEALSPNTVPRYVYCLRDWMKEKNRVSIFVMNKRTLLYPKIEVYQCGKREDA